jgi:hypothetical protein
MTIVNVKHASEQCRSTVPLLESAVSEAKAADASVRDRTQQQLTTVIILKKMRDSMQPARAAISQRCEQAAQFISLQTNLVRDVATVVMQVLVTCAATINDPFDYARFIHSSEKCVTTIFAVSSVARGSNGRGLGPAPGLQLPGHRVGKRQHRP